MKKALLLSIIVFPLTSARGADGAYRNAVLANNPVAYYEFDEADGTTAADSSGNGNTGTYTGSLGLGAASGGANLGTAVDFTGGYVDIPMLGTFGQSTFEAWVQLDEVNAGCCTGILASTGWTIGRVHINVTNGLFEHAVNSDSPAVVHATPAPVVGEWYHLVITNDVVAGQTIFYLNGVEIADDGDHTLNDIIYGPEMQIGAWEGARQLDGRIDEVAVYDSVLSPADVANHFATASGPGAGSLLITEINYELNIDSNPIVTLSWNSTPGTIYSIVYSTDLLDWDSELDDSIVGDEGGTTTRAFNLADVAELSDETKIFFRVEEAE